MIYNLKFSEADMEMVSALIRDAYTYTNNVAEKGSLKVLLDYLEGEMRK